MNSKTNLKLLVDRWILEHQKSHPHYQPHDVKLIIIDRKTGRKLSSIFTWEVMTEMNALHDINAIAELYDLQLMNANDEFQNGLL